MTAPEPQDNRIQPKMTRRKFLGRAAGTIAAAASASAVTGYLLNRSRTVRESSELPVFADYSAVEAPVGLAVAERDSPAEAVRSTVEAMGGMSRFVKPGEVVFIKPNVGFDRPAWVGATTSPEVVGEVVRLCRQAGAGEVLVGDSPINSPAGCFDRSGVGPAARQAGAKVLLPRPADFQQVQMGGRRLGSWQAYYRPFRSYNVTRVIGLPTAKQHARSRMSGAIKNWYGLLGGPRSLLHQDLDTVLVDLCRMMRPTLVIMDATRLLMRNGPTGGSRGDVRTANRIIAGTDQVAIDTLTAQWLDQDPTSIPWLGMAEQAGLGTMDYMPALLEV